LADELTVTADADVAREDGVTLLATGHPVLTQAAEHVLLEVTSDTCAWLDRRRQRPTAPSSSRLPVISSPSTTGASTRPTV
jgi:hypothetical protein